MSVMTKRVRINGNGAVTQLDLTSAVAANRRLDVLPPTDGGTEGLSFKGFSWHMSSAQARDIQIFRIDQLNSNLATLVEQRLGDTGTDGTWRPPAEEVSGYDVAVPSAGGGVGWRIQFSQAGGACNADVIADYKSV